MQHACGSYAVVARKAHAAECISQSQIRSRLRSRPLPDRSSGGGDAVLHLPDANVAQVPIETSGGYLLGVRAGARGGVRIRGRVGVRVGV